MNLWENMCELCSKDGLIMEKMWAIFLRLMNYGEKMNEMWSKYRWILEKRCVNNVIKNIGEVWGKDVGIM